MKIEAQSVLVLTPDFGSIGGVGNYYAALALPKHDSRISYFSVTSATPESNVRRSLRLLRNYRLFRRLLKRPDCRLVVLNPSLNVHSFLRDALFCSLTFAAGKQVVVFFRGWSDEMEAAIKNRAFDRLVFKYTFAKVRHFIVLGNIFRERLICLGCDPASRFWLETTVADDSDEVRLVPTSSKTTSHPRVLFMSRLVETKGAYTAVRAYAEARRRAPELSFQLVIAGDGPELEHLRKLVSGLGISDVTFAGVVQGKDRTDLLSSCDVLLFPTTHGEGMPNVILEAMLHGLVVISRPVGAIPDVIEQGTNGFLIASTNPEDFAECLLSVLVSPQLRDRIGKANKLLAMERFRASEVRSRFIAIIDECLGEAAGRRQAEP